MITKKYKKVTAPGFYGQDVRSWTEEWLQADLIKSYRNVDKDHLSPFFKKYFPRPPKKILEGGCGTGKYVVTYRKLGYDIIGVDFSKETIDYLKHMFPDMPVSCGNVTDLPFENGYFHCYYSGGVIEHFEEGPDEALKEARRVLAEGGILLATVPYLNLLRRSKLLFRTETKSDVNLIKKRPRCTKDSGIEGYAFTSYAFDRTSLMPFFEKYGFSVEEVYPCNFLQGELGKPIRCMLERRKTGGRTARGISGEVAGIVESDAATRGQENVLKQALRSFLITQDYTNLIFRYPLKLLNYLSGHMVLFVAKAV
ncbi:MAG: class I SAM-dependent methyltransferase [Candidatus Omnitrophica bacterium]|nr:class I SAM-dependent methyltransferase [Candidatus Omnitrophota bacterium]